MLTNMVPKVPRLDVRSGSPAGVAGLALWFAYLSWTPGLSPELRGAATLALLIWTVARQGPESG